MWLRLPLSFLFLPIAFILLSSSQCKNDKSTCGHRATVTDMSELDGCGLMLVLEDGRKLLPTDLNDVALQAGDIVSIDFNIQQGSASICMAEDHIVSITCLVIEERAQTSLCPEMLDPYEPAWSLEVMRELEPTRVIRLMLDGSPIYHYIGKKACSIYSCLGELLCTYSPGQQDKCDVVLKQATDSKIIFVENQAP